MGFNVSGLLNPVVNVCAVLPQKKRQITLKTLGLDHSNLCPKFAICQNCPWQPRATAQVFQQKQKQEAPSRAAAQKREANEILFFFN